MASYTPLRYPGGKAKVYKSIVDMFDRLNLDKPLYVEPYAGGAGLALKLLFQGNVSRIILNDIDYTIYCFWDSILNRTKEFLELLKDTPITIEEWHRQKTIYTIERDDQLKLGFAFFFLNRTNFSGILAARPIGGLKQTGTYKMDCRFNKDRLKKLIERIAEKRELIQFNNLDAFDFIESHRDIIEARNAFTFIDPPYFVRGKELYLNYYTPSDHKKLSDLMHTVSGNWIITYDSVDDIDTWYGDKFEVGFYDLQYSLNQKTVDTEMIIFSEEVSSLLKGSVSFDKH